MKALEGAGAFAKQAVDSAALKLFVLPPFLPTQRLCHRRRIYCLQREDLL